MGDTYVLYSFRNDTSRYHHADVGGEVSTIHIFYVRLLLFPMKTKKGANFHENEKKALCGITSGFPVKMCFFLFEKVRKIYCMLFLNFKGTVCVVNHASL